jgi:hypothetical protein
MCRPIVQGVFHGSDLLPVESGMCQAGVVTIPHTARPMGSIGGPDWCSGVGRIPPIWALADTLVLQQPTGPQNIVAAPGVVPNMRRCQGDTGTGDAGQADVTMRARQLNSHDTREAGAA